MGRLGVNALPFPHVIGDGLWDQALLDAVVSEFPDPSDPRWRTFGGERETGKLEGSDGSMWGPQTRCLIDMLTSEEWCHDLGMIFGIPDLTADTLGGGYHQIVEGGRLAVHVDFNRHTNGRHRRLNCLVYLNDGWLPEWGGELVLAGEPDKVVEPLTNRTVIFATSDKSWHGHPTPWAGPMPRRSVAVYYYSTEPAPDTGADHSTVWKDT